MSVCWWCNDWLCPLERDRSAFYESSQSSIKENTENIRELRQDNKRLYRKLAEVHTVSELPEVHLSALLRWFCPHWSPSEHSGAVTPHLALTLGCSASCRVMTMSLKRLFTAEAWRRAPTATCQAR